MSAHGSLAREYVGRPMGRVTVYNIVVAAAFLFFQAACGEVDAAAAAAALAPFTDDRSMAAGPPARIIHTYNVRDENVYRDI